MKPGELNKLTILKTLQQIFGADEVVVEHKFHPVRRWRFDYAVPRIKLAVEYDGYSSTGHQGRHASLVGMTGDAEKLNHATGLGWRVLQFTALFFRASDREKHKLTGVQETILMAIAAMQEEKENNQTTP
jgi:very-short-patch-repair endonuclease